MGEHILDGGADGFRDRKSLHHEAAGDGRQDIVHIMREVHADNRSSVAFCKIDQELEKLRKESMSWARRPDVGMQRLEPRPQ
jgi:hypothetical protein